MVLVLAGKTRNQTLITPNIYFPIKMLPYHEVPVAQWVKTLTLKGLLHCFLTCTEITGTYWYFFNLKNVENCKQKFQRVKKL